MEFNQYFNDFSTAYNEAIEKIIELREQAESLRNSMEEIIESCENIESTF